MNPKATAAHRFSGRVDDYVSGRPGYPEELFDRLVQVAALGPTSLVADIGAGPGISTEPLLRRGIPVVAVEPNDEMRRACRHRLGENPRLRIVAGSAEATGLESDCVDLVLAAQAFHWFDVNAARRELSRVLRPQGVAALVWNARRADGTRFAAAYEALLLQYGTDYRQVGHRGVSAEHLHRFFGGSPVHEQLESFQSLDREGLRARLLSSSYVPPAGAPRHEEMLTALDSLFDRHAVDGAVELFYDVELFRGPLERG